jgi:hypothetical protein
MLMMSDYDIHTYPAARNGHGGHERSMYMKQHNIYPIIVGGSPRMQLAIYNRLDKNKE